MQRKNKMALDAEAKSLVQETAAANSAAAQEGIAAGIKPVSAVGGQVAAAVSASEKLATDSPAAPSTSSPAKERLWTRDFFLLWQGQFVSAYGDRLYAIALGFWVLAVTGSTALMGTLMAVSTIPRVLISPLAGVLVDRSDRRKLLVLMDLVRGICVTLVAFAAIFGFIQIWMVFVTGICISICGAFFDPAVRSALPDITPKSKVVQANSVFSMMRTGSNIFGNASGGYLFQLLGAPLMFLCNGISYIISAFTEIFIRIPQVEKPARETHFWQDFRDGLAFIWNFRGLRYLLGIAGFINFAGNIGVILFLPLFQKTEGLGAPRYGLFMASLTLGMFLGMTFTSLVKIPPKKRRTVFFISNLFSSTGYALFPFTGYYLMLVIICVSGFFNSILNTFITSSVQITVPANMRGKVFAMMFTLFQGLSPIAIALGGILAEFFPIRWIICAAFTGVLALNVPSFFVKSFERFINFDPETETLEQIL